MTMFCGKCGNKLADGDIFCSGCGTKVNENPPAPASAEEIPEAKAFKGLLFDDKEPSYSNAKPLPVADEEEPDFDKTIIAQPENDFNQAEVETPQEAETEFAPVSAPALDFAAVKSPLFREDSVLLDSTPAEDATTFMSAPEEEATEIMSAPEEDVTEFMSVPEEDATVFMPAPETAEVTEIMPAAEDATEIMADRSEEPTQMFSDEQGTAFLNPDEEATSLLKDDSYNVYSGAVPGVTSQDFRYPTNDNAYPEPPTEMAPAFDPDATQGFDYGAQDCAPLATSAYQPPYNPYNNYPPEQAYEQPQPPKKKNTAMWVIIICISVIIVALGASCAVILTQYGSFGDFFASFSDTKKEDKADKEKNNDKEKDEPATDAVEIITEPSTVELTTEEPTTASRAYDGYCGMQLMYDFDEATGNLVIFGTGEMGDFSNVTAPWANLNVYTVIVEEGVTSITAGAFSEIRPTAISVPSTVASFDVLAVDGFGAINVSPSNPYYSSSKLTAHTVTTDGFWG